MAMSGGFQYSTRAVDFMSYQMALLQNEHQADGRYTGFRNTGERSAFEFSNTVTEYWLIPTR